MMLKLAPSVHPSNRYTPIHLVTLIDRLFCDRFATAIHLPSLRLVKIWSLKPIAKHESGKTPKPFTSPSMSLAQKRSHKPFQSLCKMQFLPHEHVRHQLLYYWFLAQFPIHTGTVTIYHNWLRHQKASYNTLDQYFDVIFLVLVYSGRGWQR
jgi:hypothetical protein